MSKEYKKKSKSELQDYLMFKRRGSMLEIKKGKGSKYSRAKEKNKFNKENGM